MSDFPEDFLNFLKQIRIPYQVAGEIPKADRGEDFMLVCASCNRAKSWSCEHCENGERLKNPSTCQQCYWANPLNYAHVAMQPFRRIELVWTGEEAAAYEQLKRNADQQGISLPQYVKDLLGRLLPPE